MTKKGEKMKEDKLDKTLGNVIKGALVIIIVTSFIYYLNNKGMISKASTALEMVREASQDDICSGWIEDSTATVDSLEFRYDTYYEDSVKLYTVVYCENKFYDVIKFLK